MIKEIEVGGVKHGITLADDMVGQGLKKEENGVVSVEKLVKVTWAELKALRDEAKLNAGTFYRITDYVTTTTQSETKSANHPFDVIVLALSENTLCEDAKAILHEGDTYFAYSDLSAWELKYCLDNDSTRFAWADKTNGKGVIYRMVDENHNDCPYDFKNILFYNTKLTTYTTSDKYYYTFSYVYSSVLYDGTTEKQVKNCFGNVMGEYRSSGVLQLNKNVFRNTLFGHICRYNTFGSNCYSNTFEENCYANIFGYDCYSNTFGEYCNSNMFGNYCNVNTFGPNCYSNTFGVSCTNNTFGSNCHTNTFRSNCRYNNFGDDLNNRSFDQNKTSITLNEDFYDDGSGQLVPIKHPDISTQPSILPYKFMGKYVYEQLIPNITLGSLIESENYYSANLGLEVRYDPYIISANTIIKTEYGVLTVPITTYTEYDIIRFKLDHVAQLIQNIGDLENGLLCQIHLIYTSMPKEGGNYYGYNNY